MAYPTADAKPDVAFFEEHGWIAVDGRRRPRRPRRSSKPRCDVILEKKETMAFDWAWERGHAEGRARLQDRAVEPDPLLPRAERRARSGTWAVEFASRADGPAARVLVRPVPRQAARERARRPAGTRTRATGAATSTTAASRAGCRCTTSTRRTAACTSSTAATSDGVLEHHRVPGVQSDLLYCEPDESRRVVVPVPRRRRHVPPQQDAAHDERQHVRRRGGASLTQHLRVVGTEGEGDHYPWKIYVNQFTGERITPPTR